MEKHLTCVVPLSSRTWMDSGSEKPSVELLRPVNLQLSIRRNLAASWYRKMAAVELDGDLRPTEVWGRARGQRSELRSGLPPRQTHVITPPSPCFTASGLSADMWVWFCLFWFPPYPLLKASRLTTPG